VLREYTLPRVYNLINDPYERDNVLFPNTWVLRTGLAQFEEHVASLKKPIYTATISGRMFRQLSCGTVTRLASGEHNASSPVLLWVVAGS
jgi:hypothetical protein